jgi:hypothetical protein
MKTYSGPKNSQIRPQIAEPPIARRFEHK